MTPNITLKSFSGDVYKSSRICDAQPYAKLAENIVILVFLAAGAKK
jgi:hypothetical protein